MTLFLVLLIFILVGVILCLGIKVLNLEERLKSFRSLYNDLNADLDDWRND